MISQTLISAKSRKIIDSVDYGWLRREERKRKAHVIHSRQSDWSSQTPEWPQPSRPCHLEMGTEEEQGTGMNHKMSEVFKVNNLRIRCTHIDSVDFFR